MTMTEIERLAWAQGDTQTADMISALYFFDREAVWKLRCGQYPSERIRVTFDVDDPV